MPYELVYSPRTDPVYNMHSYLTKVPVTAIIPFLKAFTNSGGVVVDMFAGSGMTAVAAKMCDRNAIVSDISKLGRHIGEGYLQDVSDRSFASEASRIIAESREAVGELYQTLRGAERVPAEAIRTVWSFIYLCPICANTVNYYQALKDATWDSAQALCLSCKHPFAKRGAKVIGEEAVTVVTLDERGRQAEQAVSEMDLQQIASAEAANYRNQIPSAPITPEREMYRRSALEKWSLTDTRAFFTQRNAAVLLDLWTRIKSVEDKAVQKKLMFAFTAILPRASKRYQWSHKTPLNAANQTYYIAPVFYEWNVYDLFQRKVKAAIKSDAFVTSARTTESSQKYVTASADRLKHLRDESVDYIFTDPPFGSNLFYADMSLFQECWLDAGFTDQNIEAVVKTGGTKAEKAEAKRAYEQLLTDAFREARRVLKPGGAMSVVFGNSKGEIWALAQRAFQNAGFRAKPELISILDKGQRSVKGLASGRENVATLDLIVTFRKQGDIELEDQQLPLSLDELIETTLDTINDFSATTASHIYLEILRNAMHSGVNLTNIDLANVLERIAHRGYVPDQKTGKLNQL